MRYLFIFYRFALIFFVRVELFIYKRLFKSYILSIYRDGHFFLIRHPYSEPRFVFKLPFYYLRDHRRTLFRAARLPYLYIAFYLLSSVFHPQQSVY